MSSLRESLAKPRFLAADRIGIVDASPAQPLRGTMAMSKLCALFRNAPRSRRACERNGLCAHTPNPLTSQRLRALQ